MAHWHQDDLAHAGSLDRSVLHQPALADRQALRPSGLDQVRLSIWQMALSTVQSTLWGFLVGVSTGFVAGLVLGRNDRLASIFDPYIIAFNSLPRIALVPLITMIFGFGLLAKIVLAWTIVFFIVFFNTFQGARSVDADLIHSARFLGGSDRQILTIIVPRRWRGPSPR
jgi:NitT/TauT family transport system permease protein